MIFDTAVPRSLRSWAFNTRRAECVEALELLRHIDPSLQNLASATLDQIEAAELPEDIANRATHVVTEMQRVHAAVDSLRAGGTIDRDLLYDSHASLRDRYECSSPELDWFVERAMAFEGLAGARLSGAGWGGCAIAFGEREPLTA